MQFPAVWKYSPQHWSHNITDEVLSVVTALLSHHLDDVKPINSSNNGQHELLGRDLLLDLWRDIIARNTSFPG
jgi:hypothetical protein